MRELDVMRHFTGRSLVIAYSTALIIVAAMSLASHVMLSRVLEASEGAASVVNVSGRQRMLSQRIASLSAQYAGGDVSARADLVAAVRQFETAHRTLVDGSRESHLPAAASAALEAIYQAGSTPLDPAVATFIAQARAVAALEPSDPRIPAALEPVFSASRKPLLEDLDAVVKVHERTSQQQMTMLQRMQTASLVVVLLTLVGEALGIFQPMVRRIATYSGDLLRIASVDPLTGALNRRSFSERAAAELNRARRFAKPACVLMLDADHFKSVNDRYGHGGGDAVLCALVRAVGETLRPTDLLGRLGGEEFAVLLPDADLESARAVAERIRQRIADLRVPEPGGTIAFTVSIGAAACEAQETTVQPALDRADAALYQAKAQGRNRVVSALPQPDPDASAPFGHAVAAA